MKLPKRSTTQIGKYKNCYRQEQSVTTTPSKSTVLITVEHDGCIKVFGDNHIQVRILNLPKTVSKKTELLLEEMLYDALPTRFKEIYFPGNLRSTGVIKPITLQDVIRITGNIEELYSFGTKNDKQRYRTYRQKTLVAMEA